MAIAATLLKRRQTPLGIVGLVQLTASGSYSTGGDSVDLATVVGMTNRKPDFVEIAGIAGFVYQYDQANKKVLVYCNTAGGSNAALGEHTAATYATGVSGDTILALAYWIATPKLPS
jgi:hypothetical protein